MTLSSWSLVATALLSFAAAPTPSVPAPTDGEVRAVSLAPRPVGPNWSFRSGRGLGLGHDPRAIPPGSCSTSKGPSCRPTSRTSTTASIAPASSGCGSASSTRTPSGSSWSWTSSSPTRSTGRRRRDPGLLRRGSRRSRPGPRLVGDGPPARSPGQGAGRRAGGGAGSGAVRAVNGRARPGRDAGRTVLVRARCSGRSPGSPSAGTTPASRK